MTIRLQSSSIVSADREKGQNKDVEQGTFGGTVGLR